MNTEEIEAMRLESEIRELALRERELDHRIRYETDLLELERRKVALDEFKYGMNRYDR